MAIGLGRTWQSMYMCVCVCDVRLLFSLVVSERKVTFRHTCNFDSRHRKSRAVEISWQALLRRLTVAAVAAVGQSFVSRSYAETYCCCCCHHHHWLRAAHYVVSIQHAEAMQEQNWRERNEKKIV